MNNRKEKRIEIQRFIRDLRTTDPKMKEIFQKKSYNLYLLLKRFYPEAEIYVDNQDNYITEIDGSFFDIKGEVIPNMFFYPLVEQNVNYLMKKYMCSENFDKQLIPKEISFDKWMRLFKKGYFIMDSSLSVDKKNINLFELPRHDYIVLDVADEYNYMLFKDLLNDIEFH